MEIKKALKWVAIWIGFALLFNSGVLIFLGPTKAVEFLGGYVIEQSLSIDNLFLFMLVFTSFRLSASHQRRVLNYGIIGAIVMRLIFILLGISLVNAFHWILYIFGVVLIISGIRMWIDKEEKKDIKDSKIVRLLGRIIPITKVLHGEKFFFREGKVLFATPLLAVLIVIEFTDIIFAIDSIPAIFSITTDPFIVFSSNMFAILGLRSMYFVLLKLHEEFKYVRYGVALILIFTGVKLGILLFHVEISTEISLGVIFGILISSVIISFAINGKTKKKTT